MSYYYCVRYSFPCQAPLASVKQLIKRYRYLLMFITNHNFPLAADLEDEVANANVSALDRLRMNTIIYDVNSPPTEKGKPSNITLAINVAYLDIDELSGKVTIHCWLNIHWRDDRRGWQPKDYDNITTLTVPSDSVWKPQITHFNGADDATFTVDTPLQFRDNGYVMWNPPAVYTAYCNLNMRSWPYDKQTCKFNIGTWAQNHIDGALWVHPQTLNFMDFMRSSEWEIADWKTKNVDELLYEFVQFTFVLQRRSSMYTGVIYIPASCVLLLALSCFWLPPQMGEKIMLNGILIVLVAAFLMYFSQLLPVLAGNTPLIIIFYGYCLLLLSLGTIIEVVVLYLATAEHKRRVPELLKRWLHGKLGDLLLLSNFINEAEPQASQSNGRAKELEENPYEDIRTPLDINPTETPSTRALQFDWLLLATAVDRISFCIFTLTYLLLILLYVL
ncbi:nAcRbeta-21C [Drosophila busckii]|uniref:NAcRbeta-21C n=1 Tax=Drosophila busckii TaxID=30019 RepID=A0A0M3QT97_DROBS|nr:neuronal acetylcholine receptor subunit alpha-5 [Drosophila busckii]ALC38533.1 nAcRbeta-21C [Drosophila busckii]